MKRVLFLLVVVLSMAGTACRKQDVKTFTISVPGMWNEACSNRVDEALSPVQGLRSWEIDLGSRRVTVSYDSLVLARKNIEFAIAKVGFDANDVPATDEAVNALPPECKPTGYGE